MEFLYRIFQSPQKQLSRCWGILNTLPGMLWREYSFSNRKWYKKTSCWGLVRKNIFLVFCDCSEAFLFPFVRTKEKETKRKSAGYAPELKNRRISLNEKNSLRSNSFSFFTENTRFFFTLLHWGRSSPPWRAHRFARCGECIPLMMNCSLFTSCHSERNEV